MNKKTLAIFYLMLPFFYIVKAVLILLYFLKFIDDKCNCERMIEERFYFTEKIVGATIVMSILTLIVASL